MICFSHWSHSLDYSTSIIKSMEITWKPKNPPLTKAASQADSSNCRINSKICEITKTFYLILLCSNNVLGNAKSAKHISNTFCSITYSFKTTFIVYLTLIRYFVQIWFFVLNGTPCMKVGTLIQNLRNGKNNSIRT